MSDSRRATHRDRRGRGRPRVRPDQRGERAGAKPEIQASEYWANKGDVKLYLYRKRAAPKPGETQPVLFLVHGSSNSSRSSYDLERAGQGRVLADERDGRLRLRRLDHGP